MDMISMIYKTSLRPSAYLSVLCVKKLISTQRALRYAEGRRDLNLQFLPQSQLYLIHLTIISFVIVSAEMQQAMKYQLRDLTIKGQPILLRLHRCCIYRDGNIAQIKLFLRGKRQHIRRFINTTKLPVELSNPFV